MVVRLHIYSKEYYATRKDPGKITVRRARIAHHSETNLVPASLYMNNAQAWAHRPDLGDACQEVLMRRNLRPWQWRCYIINNKLNKSSFAFI